MRLLKVFTLMLLAISITGCGFRLRGFAAIDGAGSLPFTRAYIQGVGGVSDALRRQLSAFASMRQPATVEEAQVRVSMVGEQIDQKILTINRAGQISEYRLYLNVAYRINYQGETLLGNGQMRLFRDYSYNDNTILGKESEQAMLIKDMYQDAASQVLRRTIALVKNAQNHPTNASDIITSAP